MIKNEKRTEKQEKKFIKQLKKLGFEKDRNALFFKGVFGYFIGWRESSKGDFYRVYVTGGLGFKNLAKYPTIHEVVALLKEHAGIDLSHKIKKSKKQRIADLQAENERFASERTVLRQEVDRIVNDLQNLIK